MTTTAERAFINKSISARILQEMSNGATVAQALDTVCGAGTFEKLASDLYDELRRRSA